MAEAIAQTFFDTFSDGRPQDLDLAASEDAYHKGGRDERSDDTT